MFDLRCRDRKRGMASRENWGELLPESVHVTETKTIDNEILRCLSDKKLSHLVSRDL